MLIVLDAVGLFGLRYVFCQTVFVVASALQLARFLLLFKLGQIQVFHPNGFNYC